MPKAIEWTEGQDGQIRRLCAEGMSWDYMAGVLGVSRQTVIERGRTIGAARVIAVAAPDISGRDPFPAGHSASWSALTRGTSIEDAPYPLAVFVENSCRVAA